MMKKELYQKPVVDAVPADSLLPEDGVLCVSFNTNTGTESWRYETYEEL